MRNATPHRGHNHRGNCLHPSVAFKRGEVNDVCSRHDEPRGDCTECPRCPACDRERDEQHAIAEIMAGLGVRRG